MMSNKLKVCAFVHYSVKNTLPYYVEVYLKQLSGHFDKIKVLTNNPEINRDKYFIDDKIDFIYLENRGYDFGMFYRYFQHENLANLEQLALVNDSNLVVNDLTDVFRWGNSAGLDFWGIIDSFEKPWFSRHPDNYHLQSHFLVLNAKAIGLLPDFLKTIDVDEIFNESNVKKLRRLVIEKWEIGLTQFLIAKGLRTGSFINSQQFQYKYKPDKLNLTHSVFYELVAEGYPFLKKKVILGKKLFSARNTRKWKKAIADFGNREWDFERILKSVA